MLLSGAAYAVSLLPQLGAGALLHPARHEMTAALPAACTSVRFAGHEVTLAGWACRASAARRATLVYLHGIADNRASSAGIIERFTARGFDVVAYDSRAHGQSGGAACTYGYLEKQDLRRVLDRVEPGPVVLVGTSLGAAVALQSGAIDSRITAIVAAETFSDLRTVANERAPFFFSRSIIARAFDVAEEQGRFRAADISPAEAAKQITVPVLLIHGAADIDTPPAHSQRVFDALRGPKRLILVPGARHNESLRGGEIWNTIESWIDAAVTASDRRGRPVPSWQSSWPSASDPAPRNDRRRRSP